MLEEKTLKEIKTRIIDYQNREIIKTKNNPRFTEFFLKNAEDSIESAKVLFEITTNPEKQKQFGFTNFNGLLWVVNASYYSMFYMTRALLENEGIKIKTDLSIHLVTFDVLVHYFYLTKKLQKEFIEDLLEAENDAAELLGKQNADEIIEEYYFERRKRGIFTYEMGEILLQTKAKTSLERAQKFRKEILSIIHKY